LLWYILNKRIQNAANDCAVRNICHFIYPLLPIKAE
jgi:hypothetical protein